MKTENCHVQELEPLVSPAEVKAKYPISDDVADLVLRTRQQVRELITGADRERLFDIIGPCSIHDPNAAYEYAEKLKVLADKTSDHLLLVMRTYFEKPRTTVGWKGLINDPGLDNSFEINRGLRTAR